MHRRSSLLPVLILAAAACAEADIRPDAFAVRDSAGIRIVESLAPAWTEEERWRLSAEPVLQLGQLEGAPEYQLDRVRDVRRLSTGEVAIANGGSNEIRVYGPEGEFRRSMGREGGGPGEFRALSWIQALAADSLLAYDARERRISVFAPDGSFARSTTLQPNAAGPTPRPLALLADGGLLSTVSRLPKGPPPEGLTRIPISVSRISQDGASVDAITDLAGDERMMELQSAAGGVVSIRMQTHPFYRRSEARASAGGVYAADTDRYEVRLFDAEGRNTRIIRRPVGPTPLEQTLIEAYRQERLEEADSPDQRRRIDASFPEILFPEVIPAFSGFRSDTEGRLWVQEFEWRSHVGTEWSVFDTDGHWLGNVGMPAGFDPVEIGGDYVLGTWRDEFELEYVRMFELVKP